MKTFLSTVLLGCAVLDVCLSAHNGWFATELGRVYLFFGIYVASDAVKGLAESVFE